MSSQYDAHASLGQEIFGAAQLGDRRRTKRLVKTFDRMSAHPGGTLPDKLASPPDLRGFYRLCDDDDVTHQAIIEPARAYTQTRIEACPHEVLLLHDATELDYTTLTSLAEDLGQIGKGSRRGYLCHNVLAVAADSGEVLGLRDQILHHRDQVSKDETLAEHRDRPTRESRLWVLGTRHLPADPRLIDIADQGADTFEFLEHESRSGRRFVIRASKTRLVHAGHTPTGPRLELKAYARGLPELGRFTMDVQPQPGRMARKDAEFVVRAAAVLVCPPHAKAGHHGDDALPMYVVQVTEVSPPEGEKTIEWTLLTNERVETFEDALRVTGWYERRWVVEEYHKAQKTGCGIEDMQFTTTERLEPAIALLSVVAVTLLNLREASRRDDAKTRRADTVLSSEYVEVLSLTRYGQVRHNLTIHEFFLALARLGGHQNRKCDGPPGWLVLWRGWMKLQAMLDGYLAAQRKICGKT
jgi:Transposase DNA-binding